MTYMKQHFTKFSLSGYQGEHLGGQLILKTRRKETNHRYVIILLGKFVTQLQNTCTVYIGFSNSLLKASHETHTQSNFHLKQRL